MSRANGVPHFTSQDKSDLHELGIAIDDPAPDRASLVAEYEKRLGEMHAYAAIREQVIAELQAALEYEAGVLVTSKARAERWRRRFLWAVLPPAVLILTAGWGLIFAWVTK